MTSHGGALLGGAMHGKAKLCNAMQGFNYSNGYAPGENTPALGSCCATPQSKNARHWIPNVLKSVSALSIVGVSLPSKKANSNAATSFVGDANNHHFVDEKPDIEAA